MSPAHLPHLPLELPRPPEPAAPFRFPIVAAVAPVLVAGVVFLVTRSALALAFAGLGPVAAIAGYCDSRFSARRQRRRETARFADERDAYLAELARRHDREREVLREVTPEPVELLRRSGPDPYQWRADSMTDLLVTLGVGPVPSAQASDRAPTSGTPDPAVERELRELADRARVVTEAPVTVDARLGIGIAGPPALAASVARSVTLQLARALSPAGHWLAGHASARSGPADTPPVNEALVDEARFDEAWLDAVPHEPRPARVPGSFAEFGVRGREDPVAVIAIADAPAALPAACRVVVGVEGSRLRIIGHPDPERRALLGARPVSRREAWAVAARLASDAARAGIARADARLPDAVELGTLLRPGDDTDATSLACEPAVAADGPLTLDLVRDGPHAVVGGTTGSGKSELLIAWVIAMANSRSPHRVTFLLIDFKGGAAFAALARLPHTVGTITDLDARTAHRGLESLRAEVRYRERVLLEQNARSIDDAEGLPRLVIVVDEFAAMLAETPELHALFSDLAARGRSLGIHLLLCTQRPAGVVRDGVLANADLRISLRVNNRADSQAVVACDDAADIALAARGRAIVRLAGQQARPVQFALARGADIDEVARRWAHSPPVRRPWCEPLPEFLSTAALERSGGAGAFGLCDLPAQQRQEPARLAVARSGSAPPDGGRASSGAAVLVLGASQSGRSTALRALAAGRPGTVVVSTSPDAAWDAVEELIRRLDDPVGAGAGGTRSIPRLAVLDDVDALVPRFTGEYRQAFVDALVRLLREGPARGLSVALAAQRITGELQSVAALVGERLLLRHSSRQDFVLAGGDAALFEPGLPPGRAVWRGQWVQLIGDPPPLPAPESVRAVPLDPARPAAIVTNRVATVLSRWARSVSLSEAGPDLGALIERGISIVGDVDDWQSRWGAIAGLRGRAQVIVDGCTPADLRAVTRSRHLPPPLTEGHCWRVDDEGRVERARLDWPS